METFITISITPDELRNMIREEIRDAVKPPDSALTPKQAAAILGKSVKTISRMKSRGEISPLHPFGQPRYSEYEIKGLKKSHKY